MSHLLNEFIKIEDQWFFKEDPDSLVADNEESPERINEQLRAIIKKQREAVKQLRDLIESSQESDVIHDGSKVSCIKFNCDDEIGEPSVIDPQVSLQSSSFTAEKKELNGGQIHRVTKESKNTDDETTKVSFVDECSDTPSVSGSDVPSTEVEIARNELVVDGGNSTLIPAVSFLSHEMKSLPRISSTYVGEKEYCMNYSRRGYAAIFNHYFFDVSMGCKLRKATEVDCGRLEKTLDQLGFEVEIYPDFSRNQIHTTLREISRKDFSDCDCLMVVVLSHGEEGKIAARDGWYDFYDLTKSFHYDKCPSLFAKPKVFIHQICRGESLDRGPAGEVETDSGGGDYPFTYRLPVGADFLLAYSSSPGYYSFRDKTTGSFYIETLCQEIDRHSAYEDFVTILTSVNKKVAEEYEVKYKLFDGCKQQPCFTSMLTRKLYFYPK